jgi:hypothetical protein
MPPNGEYKPREAVAIGSRSRTDRLGCFPLAQCSGMANHLSIFRWIKKQIWIPQPFAVGTFVKYPIRRAPIHGSLARGEFPSALRAPGSSPLSNNDEANQRYHQWPGRAKQPRDNKSAKDQKQAESQSPPWSVRQWSYERHKLALLNDDKSSGSRDQSA